MLHDFLLFRFREKLSSHRALSGMESYPVATFRLDGPNFSVQGTSVGLLEPSIREHACAPGDTFTVGSGIWHRIPRERTCRTTTQANCGAIRSHISGISR